MKIIECKICKCKEDEDYTHPIYDGKRNIYISICSDCRMKLFYPNKPEIGKQMNEWIRFSDRFPLDGQMIAACSDRLQTGCICRYCDYEEERLPCLVSGPLRCLGISFKDLTHWMPLPLPPLRP